MLIRLTPDSGIPMYRQIADAVTEQIQDGSLEAGYRLPPARTLAETVGVNMHTVLRAYAELEAEGLVDKRRGRGGVVVSPEASLLGLVGALVKAARRQGVSRPQLIEMVDKSW